MGRVSEKYKIKMSPVANRKAIVQGDKYRFTVLTPQLIRLEYDEAGIFEDRATQVVLNRNFPVPEFRVVEKPDSLEIITSKLYLVYDKKRFSKNGLSIDVNGNVSDWKSKWHFGESFVNLKGTARTLDEADGAVALEDGILSHNGFSVLDDSKSLIIDEDGWVTPREGNRIDTYFFGYGRDYLECLKDFFRLCGETPLIPRFALGNWWSRYHKYTDTEYKELMERFEKEGIPFSVAVIDMDWHLVDIDPKYGSGWTGYTWNREFFPDPKEFMDWLHKKGLRITLNVHPADGVRAHEEMYVDMAKELGVDYEKGDKINFDITDPKFMEAYFNHLHHPNEEMGVDFWWIDWQQGTTTKIEGLDPLWMLNHYHYLDNKRDGKRPLILSRYAGPGSHRYPVGFSGDAVVTWESLDFQPYFTATASNIGYGWWSHDIGGHMYGYKDDQLFTRWVQFGVFSPIMRLHSSNNPFIVKEPWQFNPYTESIVKKFLFLRHQLVPYLYTMNHRFNKEGEPLIQPMYYKNPFDDEAYKVPNQYWFGTDMIVCPITKPVDEKLTMGSFDGWLPEGTYFDFFNGRVYKGGRRISLFRGLDTIPVLVKAGSIIPMTDNKAVRNEVTNPEALEIRIYAGENGTLHLYEDNGLSPDDSGFMDAITTMEFKWGETSEFVIKAVNDKEGVIPRNRDYRLKFIGVEDTCDISVSVSGKETTFHKEYDNSTHTLQILLTNVETNKDLKVKLHTEGCIAGNNISDQVFELLNKAQIEYELKTLIYKVITKHSDRTSLLGELSSMGLDRSLLSALFEILTAY
ncbi:MAG: alpha-xylosidase [Clostridiaceae bacterium]|nr:alpha-xylosidase [Clostridiaceae bacterium]